MISIVLFHISIPVSHINSGSRSSQRRSHISRANTVNPNPLSCPLDRQARCQMPDRRLTNIIRRLSLRQVYNSSAHATNEHKAALRLASNEMLGDSDSEKVRAVHVDSEEAAHALDGVGERRDRLGEASGGDEGVDLAMLGEDFCYCGCDEGLGGNVCVMGCDFGNAVFACQRRWSAKGTKDSSYTLAFGCAFLKSSTIPSASLAARSSLKGQLIDNMNGEKGTLFRSTRATLEPLRAIALLMTSPRPWAPPVTTVTLPAREKLGRVGWAE